VFTSKKGTALIEQAIGQFGNVVEQIERGVADNLSEIDANVARIEQLDIRNVALKGAVNRGRSVAAKIRELIS
jgi:hypothetical protein